MKGLLRQSAMSLGKMIAIFAVAVVIFYLSGSGASARYFILAYAIMFPASMLGQDEMSGFDRLVMMTPLRPVTYVLHKFLLSWLAMAVGVAAEGIRAGVVGGFDADLPMTLAVSLLTQAVALTLMLHLGMLKSRWAYIGAIIIQVGFMSAIAQVMGTLGLTSAFAVDAAMVGFAALINIAAVPLATKLFVRRMTA